jgi:hypothetical protein
MKSAAQVRAQVEAALGPSFPSPFALQQRRSPELVPTGLAAIDALTGGLPRSSLTEISGPPSSGRTTLELALLATLTSRGEACALIDAEDAFDPASAQAAGVALDRLLWVRCHGLEQALRAVDLLLGAGGFGAAILDLADVPARRTRRVPLSYWFRFRRAVEHTPTVLALIDEEPCAQSSASLVLRLEAESVEWSAAADIETRNSKFEARNSKLEIRNSKLDIQNSKPEENSKHKNSRLETQSSPILSQEPRQIAHARLLRGIRWRAEVIRNRNSKREIRNSKLEVRNSNLEARTASSLDLSCRPRLHDFQVSCFDSPDPSFQARARHNAQPRVSNFDHQSAIDNHQ